MTLLPHVADWLDPLTFYQRAMEARNRGRKDAGHIGTSCPDCWRQIPVHWDEVGDDERRLYCQCDPGKTVTWDEAILAHGLEHLTPLFGLAKLERVG